LATDIPIETADERLTTEEAHKTLLTEDYSREKRKQFVDSLAATYILEGYLRNQKNKG
jgi:putative Holliday junction resolvase